MYDTGDAALKPNARTSGVKVDRATLKRLGERSDKPGLIWLAIWITCLAISGGALYWSLYLAPSIWWAVPTTFLFGSIMALPGYALSHECAHSTAFKTQWLNETCYWISSLIYFEPPHHRRIAHGRHHTHTWVQGHDAQITFNVPMHFKGWFSEFSQYGLLAYEMGLILRNAFGRPDDFQRSYCSKDDLRKIFWQSWIFIVIVAGLGGIVIAGYLWPVTFILIPRLIGSVTLGAFVVLQHAETEMNTPDIRKSTRSFATNAIGRFLYMNMNYHVEHHLFPAVPFHRLAALSEELDGQLPEPDPGVFMTNWELFKVVMRRTFGKPAHSAIIRQASAPEPAE